MKSVLPVLFLFMRISYQQDLGMQLLYNQPCSTNDQCLSGCCNDRMLRCQFSRCFETDWNFVQFILLTLGIMTIIAIGILSAIWKNNKELMRRFRYQQEITRVGLEEKNREMENLNAKTTSPSEQLRTSLNSHEYNSSVLVKYNKV